MLLARLVSRSRLRPALKQRPHLFARSLGFQPSPEQEQVVELIKSHNLVISACPGAGKTATAQAIAAANPGVPILLMTYNKALQTSTAARLSSYSSVNVSTCHSLATRFFGETIKHDGLLRDWRFKESLPCWSGPLYEIVIMDELQDNTDDLYWLQCAFLESLRARGAFPRVVCLGDSQQAIYQYRGASHLFLDLAPDIFKEYSSKPWARLTYTKSMRCTETNAAFYNDVCFNDQKQYITGTGTGPRPLYFVADLNNTDGLLDQLIPMCQEHKWENCVILAPFVRHNKTLSQLENDLSVKWGVPVAVSQNDRSQDEDTTRGKLVIQTFHSFKGSERDLVILFLDRSYFSNLGKYEARDRCPNLVYVAVTRAKTQLVIVQSSKNQPMPFFDMSCLRDRADLVNLSSIPDEALQDLLMQTYPQDAPLPFGSLSHPSFVRVTELTRFTDASELDALASSHLERINITPPGAVIGAPHKVLANPQLNMWEPVSDVNGLVPTAAFEILTRRTLTTFGGVRNPFSKLVYPRPSSREFVIWLTRRAVEYTAKESFYISRLIQLQDHPHDWLIDSLRRAVRKLRSNFKGRYRQLDFEQYMKIECPVNDHTSRQNAKITLEGIVDVVESGQSEMPIIWEMKFVGSLTSEHFIQVALYAYIWALLKGSNTLPQARLFNIQNGEIWDVRSTIEEVGEMLLKILKLKYTFKPEPTEEEFLERCRRTREEVASATLGWKNGHEKEDGRA